MYIHPNITFLAFSRYSPLNDSVYYHIVSCPLVVLFLYNSNFKTIQSKHTAAVFIKYMFIFQASLKRNDITKKRASSFITLTTCDSNASFKVDRLFPILCTIGVQLLVVVNRLFTIFVCYICATMVLRDVFTSNPGSHRQGKS